MIPVQRSVGVMTVLRVDGQVMLVDNHAATLAREKIFKAQGRDTEIHNAVACNLCGVYWADDIEVRCCPCRDM